MTILVGKKTPEFEISAMIEYKKIVESFSLEQFKDKYILLFFPQKNPLLYIL